MKRPADFPLLSQHLSRRSFVAGVLIAGGALAVPMRQAMAFAPGDPVVTTADVNLRTGPGLRFEVIEILQAGTSGTVGGIPDPNDADGYTWVGFELADGTRGYVASEFLASAMPARPNLPLGSQVIVTTDALNVRDQAGLSGAVIKVVYYGAIGYVKIAPVANDGYWWIDVAFSDAAVDGWVAAEFIQLYSGEGGNFSVGDSVYVASGPLNFRVTPTLSGNILRTLQTGDTGLITDGPVAANGYVWYRLELSTGEVGWVVQDFLSAGSPPADVQVGDTIKVVDGPLNIRSGPGSTYGVIDVAATGAIATVVDGPTSANGYTWIKIIGNLLAEGWVAFEFCAVV